MSGQCEIWTMLSRKVLKYALTTAAFTRWSSAAVNSDAVPPPEQPSVATRLASTSGRVLT